MLDDTECKCASGQTDTGNGCSTDGSCAAGQYKDYSNICNACGDNCASCSDGTGTCEVCEGNYELSNGKCKISGCAYPYGPVDDPAGCVDEPYSSSKLLEPFSSYASDFNWCDRGICNPIVSQGICGSCWAFMAIGNLELAYAVKYGPTYKLSEQQLVSCDNSNNDCYGGWPTSAYQYLSSEGSILSSDYPYISGKDKLKHTCKSAGKPRVFYTDASSRYSSFNDLDSNNWSALVAELRNQPVGVAIAFHDNMFFLSDFGVWDGPCAPEGLNHGIVAVGYGSEGGTEFIIIRNSHGTDFG